MSPQQLNLSRATLERFLKAISVLVGTSHLRDDVDVSDEYCCERLFESCYDFTADRPHAIAALKEVQELAPGLAPILTSLYDHRDAALIQALGRGQLGDDFRATYQEIIKEKAAAEKLRQETRDQEDQRSILELQRAATAQGEIFCPHCKTVVSASGYCDCD